MGVNDKNTSVNKQNTHIDKRYVVAYKESHKAGNCGYVCLAVGPDAMRSLANRFHRYKYNMSISMTYISEVLWDFAIRKWHRENED